MNPATFTRTAAAMVAENDARVPAPRSERIPNMSTPHRPIPTAQATAFGKALCERLGLDPEITDERIDWSIEGGEELARISLTVYLPSQEVLDMFNAAGASVGGE